MMYFDTKNEIEYLENFLRKYEGLREIEKDAREELRSQGTQFITVHGVLKATRESALENFPEYQLIREKYTKMIPIVNQICRRESINCDRIIQAARMEGGRTFQGSVFEFVLNPPSDLYDIDNVIRDTINQAIGVLEQKVRKEKRQLLNPFYWIWQLIILVLRLPYTLIKVSGFNVSKFEDHLIGKIVHMIYVVMVALLLIWLGVESITDLIKIIGPLLVP